MSMVNVAGSNSTTTITGLTDEAVQPNAVDLTLGKVFRIKNDLFVIDANNNKQHRGVEEIQPDEDGFFYLEPGSYEAVAQETVAVGEDEAGYIIGRSSLNRNNILIRSCLYDSGYNGVCAFVMTIGSGPVKIQKGTRFGQYVSWKAEALKSYNGSYGFGTSDDSKYGVSEEKSE